MDERDLDSLGIKARVMRSRLLVGEWRVRSMRRRLAEHPSGLDPDCPPYTSEDVDELERELARQEP